MPISSVDYLVLTNPSGGEDRARDFYNLALGLDEITPPGGAAEAGELWFNCHGLPLRITFKSEAGGAPSRQILALRVSDLADLQAALEAQNFPVTGAAPHLICTDPGGNRFLLLEHAAGSSLLDRPVVAADYAAGDGDAERVAISPDGQWLAMGTTVEGTDGRPVVVIWKFGQPGDPEVVIDMADSVWELAFSPSGRELAGLSEDGSLETWRVGDFESDQFVELPANSKGLAYSAEGGLLAVGAGNKVEVYRPGLDHLATVRPGLGTINAVAFDPAGILAVSAEAERIQLWQIRPAQLSSWEVIGHGAPALQLRAHPFLNVLAALTDSDQVLLWNVDQAPETPVDLTFDLSNVNALAFSPDGALLAAGDEDGRLRLIDWQNRTVVRELPAELPVLALAFAPDGQHLAVGHEGARVRVWKIK